MTKENMLWILATVLGVAILVGILGFVYPQSATVVIIIVALFVAGSTHAFWRKRQNS